LRERSLLLLEVARVLRALPRTEARRRRSSLHHAVAAARARAANAPARTDEARARLRRAIALVDRGVVGGPNCVRRSLLEMTLDAGAARERLFAGFRAGGGAGSGHAWLESQPTQDAFDAVITL
jgi:hypothetical protein